MVCAAIAIMHLLLCIHLSPGIIGPVVPPHAARHLRQLAMYIYIGAATCDQILTFRVWLSHLQVSGWYVSAASTSPHHRHLASQCIVTHDSAKCAIQPRTLLAHVLIVLHHHAQVPSDSCPPFPFQAVPPNQVPKVPPQDGGSFTVMCPENQTKFYACPGARFLGC